MECQTQVRRQEYSDQSSQSERQSQAERTEGSEEGQRKTIYKITNLLNGKVYVGCCSNMSKRKYAHKQRARTMDYGNKNKLYPDMRKYGENSFCFEVIETCSSFDSRRRESFWIRKFCSFINGYNTTPHGLCGPAHWTGKKRQDISVRRIKDKQILTAIDATRIPVYCIESGETFDSITEAANSIGRTVSALAYAVRRGGRCKKMTFIKIKKEDRNGRP